MANTLKVDRVFCVLALIALVVSCSGGETQQPPPQSVPVSGQQIFESRCAFCHGVAGAGDTAVGNSFPNANLADGVWVHGSTPAAISTTIQNGVPGTPMEGYQGLLSPDEINRVRDYIISLKK